MRPSAAAEGVVGLLLLAKEVRPAQAKALSCCHPWQLLEKRLLRRVPKQTSGSSTSLLFIPMLLTNEQVNSKAGLVEPSQAGQSGWPVPACSFYTCFADRRASGSCARLWG